MTAICVADIEQSRANTFSDTLACVLSSKLARTTLALIIDGIPTEEYFRVCTGGTREDLFGRTGPSQESFQLADDLCRNFSPESLYINAEVQHHVQP